MLREYKFRAEPIHGEGFVYGYFKKNRYGDCYIEYDCRSTVVKPDSVVPLVGYDKDGDEVYEGDWLWDENDENFFQVIWDDDDQTFYLDGYKCGYGEHISKLRFMSLSEGPNVDEEEE